MRYRKITEPNSVVPCCQLWRRSWVGGGSGYWGPWVLQAPLTNSTVVSSFPNAIHSGVWDELHPGPPYKEGGPFNKWTFRTDAAIPKAIGTFESRVYGTLQYKVSGGVPTTFAPDYTYFPGIQNNNFLKKAGDAVYYGPDGTHTWGDFSSYGAKAWRKFSPGRASADAATFLGEFREMPRMLKSTARRFYELWRSATQKRGRRYDLDYLDKARLESKKISGDWLSANFGWLPFLSDLRKFYVTYRKADRIMQYLIRHNGQWVKRGGTVLEDENVEVLSSGVIPNWAGAYCSIGDLFYTAGYYGQRTLRRITSQRVWFEGRFRYWIPNIDSIQWRESFIQKLFGLQLTPAVIWNLTPWSWLVDWFGNVGEILDNLSGPALAENLVAKYAYLMGSKHTALRETKTLSFTGGPKTLEYYWSLERKTRGEANPFGFGVSWDGLSPRQWSLLAALGLQRYT